MSILKKRFLIAALCLITVLSLAFTGCQREKASSDANDKEITSSSTSDDIIYNQKELQEPKELTVSEKGTLEIEVETLAKPDNTVAIRKSGVTSGEIWYCGDNPQADIEGASQVGIYPVWYDNDTDKDYKDRSNEHLPQCEHLHIHEWNEMIDLLERIKT